MRKFLVKLCAYLEKKLYDAPTYDQLSKLLDETEYKLYETEKENEYLKDALREVFENR